MSEQRIIQRKMFHSNAVRACDSLRQYIELPAGAIGYLPVFAREVDAARDNAAHGYGAPGTVTVHQVGVKPKPGGEVEQ